MSCTNSDKDITQYFSCAYRLYTAPKDHAYYNTLTSARAYERVMKNNLDFESSFNSWDISIQNTLNKPKSAIFADSGFFDWGKGYWDRLHCLVRLRMMM